MHLHKVNEMGLTAALLSCTADIDVVSKMYGERKNEKSLPL